MQIDPRRKMIIGSTLDVGDRLGWKLLASAITPIWSGSQLDHYLFTDSGGVKYRLDQNTGGVWTSQEGIYASYDANTNRLYFPDGSFWVMGCVSAGGGTGCRDPLPDPPE